MKKTNFRSLVVLLLLWLQLTEHSFALDQKPTNNSSTPNVKYSAYKAAAESGNVDAQYLLGLMYSKGDDIPEDQKKAVEWYTKAAEQGHEEAQRRLAKITNILKVTLAFKNGTKFVGEFRDGKRNGIGTYSFANGTKFVGEFKDGKRNGKGTYSFANGTKFVGEFKDGKRSGNGTYTFTNGTKFVGGFKDGKRNGKGTYTYANGTSDNGLWKNGVKITISKTYTDLTTGMEFVLVPGGCFQMGDGFGDGSVDEKPIHEVCVNTFYMGKFEVTQGEYQKVTGDNPSTASKGDRYPVESVSWSDTQIFLTKLNLDNNNYYRMPTEAEWEYAARSGGNMEKFAGGDDVETFAWYHHFAGSFIGKVMVGQKRPNGIGLYDMSGNISEWCGDWYGIDFFEQSPWDNPTGPASGKGRVVRGGSTFSSAIGVRTTHRSIKSPNSKIETLGFRIVLPVQ